MRLYDRVLLMAFVAWVWSTAVGAAAEWGWVVNNT